MCFPRAEGTEVDGKGMFLGPALAPWLRLRYEAAQVWD